MPLPGMMGPTMSDTEGTARVQHSGRDPEMALRARLGIPADARRIIVFAESSHWDPNWRFTSEEYFERLVGPNLDKAVSELLREPRRVFSIECVFFLRMYWDKRPEKQDTVRTLVNEGRLRLTSSGVTTADTQLPGAEAILRDLLIGQEWLRSNGMSQEPSVAYFPDSFGHSPALPSLLKAAGFSLAAITHVDGMLHPSSYHELICKRFPRPYSSAALLMKESRCADFIWRGPDGAEVLCHWNVHDYRQGDMLAHRGVARVYLFPTAIHDPSDRNVSGKIRRFARQLAPYSQTPYLFCPVGGDFIDTIPDLVALLDRYNRIHYPTTGMWALNAGLDDYLALVDCRRDVLPVLELDPNPRWMGFYASRPTLKRKCHELVDLLLLAGQLAVLPENEGQVEQTTKDIEEAWWHAAASNHHDFVTGTATDHVVRTEQEPWLDKGIAEANAAIEGLAPRGDRRVRTTSAPLPEWRRHGDILEISTPRYVIELAENKGGSILRAWNPVTQAPFLSVSNYLVSYRDSGGLWRMGHEFCGGSLKEAGRSSNRPAPLEVYDRDGCLEAACTVEVDGQTVRQLYRFSSGSPAVRFRVEGQAAERRTVTIRFGTGLAPSRMAMDVPGGIALRPLQKIYAPTFWPAQSFVHLQDSASGRGIALCLAVPGAVACRPDGTLELVALRNATSERAFGFLPLLGMTVSGHERSRHVCEYALLFTEAGDCRENPIPLMARNLLARPWDSSARAGLRELAASLVTTDRPEVMVTAVKPASRGGGTIVRLSTCAPAGLPVEVSVRGRPLKAAFLCDARERDLEPLPITGQGVRLTMPGAIASVRMLT